MTDRADENPDLWGDRRRRGDGAAARGTSGAAAGTSGFRLTLGAWALAAALMALVTFVNVATILDDARRRGAHMPLALPLTLETTSALAALASLFIVVVALRIAPPGRGPWWRAVAVHAVGTLAFSVTHITLMTLLRAAIAALVRYPYSFSPSEIPYEYRKDLLSYLVIGGVFWLVERERERLTRTAEPRTEPRAEPAALAAGPATFDIRDGASILRVPVGEILAAQAAGNYVEFALEDGRRPLMRASMAAVEAALAAHGFVRTHRSWLVNAQRVRALTAAGSGDFRLDLGCNLTAPLSRRYPAALARLRGEV